MLYYLWTQTVHLYLEGIPIRRIFDQPLLKKLFPFAFFLPVALLPLWWVILGDVEYSNTHIMTGRLAACAAAGLAALLLAGLVSLAKAAVTGAPALHRGALLAWLRTQRPAPWLRVAGLAALFCLPITLLAEDYARVMEGLIPFSLARWLPFFLMCLVCLTPLFRFFKTSAACRMGIACLPAVVLPACRWFARYTTDTKLLLAALILVVFSLALRALGAGHWRDYVPNAWFALLLLGVSGMSAFLWCYNKIVYDPRTITLGAGGVLFFLLAMLTMACVGLSLLVFLFWLQGRLSAQKTHTLNRPAPHFGRLFLLFFGIMAAGWLLWWWAYRPGTMSADSVHQWRQATGSGGLEDSHPILSSLWLTPFARLGDTPTLFTFFQVLLCAAVFAALLTWFCRKGLPRWACTALAAGLALLPPLAIHTVTVWKDVTFCLGVLWLAFLLARLVEAEKLSVGFAIEAAVALVVVACFRHNGIVVAALSAAVLLGVGLRRRLKQAVAGVLVGLALVMFVQGPLYGLLGVPHYSMGLSGLGASSVGSALTYGADLPEDVAALAEEAAPREEWVARFAPYNYFGYFNYSSLLGDNPFFAPFQEKGSLWVVGMWLRMFLRSPLVMFHERMAMSDSLLFVDKAPHPEAFIYPYHNTLYENDLGLALTDSPLRQFFDGALEWTEDTSPRLAIFWRCGIWWILCLWVVYFNFLQKRGRRSWYFVPMLANVLTLMLALTEQGYRYTWVIIPYALFGLLLAALPGRALAQAEEAA